MHWTERLTKGRVAVLTVAVILLVWLLITFAPPLSAQEQGKPVVTPAPAATVEAPAPAAMAKPAPVLSELDELKIENAVLRLRDAQQQTEKLSTALQALIGSLQKPGFVIAQLPDGKFGYAPEAKRAAPPKGPGD